jgi:hypothetical protein
MEDLRTELAAMLDEAEWNWLLPHAERGMLVIVSDDLDLLDVGMAIATDNTQSVQHWIGQSLLYKPSPDQIADWNTNDTRRFQALIVKPYVLMHAA